MLRVKEVVKMLGVSKATVYNWIKKGLPIIKVGKITFIEEKELYNFIKRGE